MRQSGGMLVIGEAVPVCTGRVRAYMGNLCTSLSIPSETEMPLIKHSLSFQKRWSLKKQWELTCINT